MAKKHDNPIPNARAVSEIDTATSFEPRVVEGKERANKEAGETRFKVRCTNYGARSHLYIIAADESSARECYLKNQGLEEEHARLKADGVEKIEPPRLHVTTLPD